MLCKFTARAGYVIVCLYMSLSAMMSGLMRVGSAYGAKLVCLSLVTKFDSDVEQGVPSTDDLTDAWHRAL